MKKLQLIHSKNDCEVNVPNDVTEIMNIGALEHDLDELLTTDLLSIIDGLIDSDNNIIHTEKQYPFYPEVKLDQQIENLVWFLSEDLSFGCWIQDNRNLKSVMPNRNPLRVVSNIQVKYKSSIPLHDHFASDNIKSRMVWVINERGYGQYGVGIGNQIHLLENQ